MRTYMRSHRLENAKTSSDHERDHNLQNQPRSTPKPQIFPISGGPPAAAAPQWAPECKTASQTEKPKNKKTHTHTSGFWDIRPRFRFLTLDPKPLQGLRRLLSLGLEGIGFRASGVWASRHRHLGCRADAPQRLASQNPFSARGRLP